MALENLDFADGWHRLLGMIGPRRDDLRSTCCSSWCFRLPRASCSAIIAIIPASDRRDPCVVAVLAGRAAGMGWNVTTISLAIIFGTLLLLLLIYLIALVSVPATVFFPAYALYFLAARYPNLDVLLHPVPVPPPAPELPPIRSLRRRSKRLRCRPRQSP
jgi:phage shock protein PspC (stress-responsive transcriptional regulator)